MPYGRRKYSNIDKSVVQIDSSSMPTFICPRCGKVKQVNSKSIEITALQDNLLFLYSKICTECGKFFRDWITGK